MAWACVEILTSPFSFVATTSTMVWEGLQPRFVDIDQSSLNLSPQYLERASFQNVSAVVSTHVYGNPSGATRLDGIAKDKDVPLIFDAAHAFGVDLNSESVFCVGDASAISFHATKIFHTAEGGAIVTNDSALANEARLLRNFGLESTVATSNIGTNAKMSELHAALGLCILDDLDFIFDQRKMIGERYRYGLEGWVEFQQWSDNSTNNHSYAPVIFKDSRQVTAVKGALQTMGVQTREYFSPSLNTLFPSITERMPNSENIAKRILCLPIYSGLNPKIVSEIIVRIKSVIEGAL